MGILLAVVFGGLLGWNFIKSKLRTAYLKRHPPPALAVSTAKAKAQSWESTVSSVATLVAAQQVQVTSQAGGKVTEIRFKDGQQVQKGDLLVVLDDTVQRAQLASAIAARSEAADKMKRYKPLVEEGAISQLRYDDIVAKHRETSAQVEEARGNLAYVRVTAPFSGRLGIRQVNLGQLVQPGTTIVELDTEGSLYCDFTLPQSDRSEVSVGQTVTFTSNTAPDRKFSGEVTAISPRVDTNTRNFSVRATFPNDDGALVPGAFGKVTIGLAGASEVVTIPTTAIDYTLYGDTVFVVQTDKPKKEKEQTVYQVKKASVTPGEKRGDVVAVAKGLQAGQIVVTSGQLRLSDGDWVRLRQDELTPPKTLPLE